PNHRPNGGPQERQGMYLLHAAIVSSIGTLWTGTLWTHHGSAHYSRWAWHPRYSGSAEDKVRAILGIRTRWFYGQDSQNRRRMAQAVDSGAVLRRPPERHRARVHR